MTYVRILVKENWWFTPHEEVKSLSIKVIIDKLLCIQYLTDYYWQRASASGQKTLGGKKKNMKDKKEKKRPRPGLEVISWGRH